MIVGHDELRKRLSHDVPPTVLVEGPEGIGKSLVLREAANALAPSYAVTEVGRSICVQKLDNDKHTHHGPTCATMTATVAYHIIESLAVRARVTRVIIFDASTATTQAMNAMLKTLEDPPPNTHLLMQATSGLVLPTIRSRSTVMHASPLTDEEVEDLLMEWGVQRDKAHRASLISNGRPGLAKKWADAMQHRGTVIQTIKAGMEKDKILLANICQGLQPISEEERAELIEAGDTRRGRNVLLLLGEAVRQARTGARGLFDEDELGDLTSADPAALDKILKKLQNPPRAELAARSAVLELWRT